MGFSECIDTILNRTELFDLSEKQTNKEKGNICLYQLIKNKQDKKKKKEVSSFCMRFEKNVFPHEKKRLYPFFTHNCQGRATLYDYQLLLESKYLSSL